MKAYKQESYLNTKLSNEIKRVDSQKLEIGRANIKEIYIIFEMPIDKNKFLNGVKEFNEFHESLKAKNKSNKFV